MPDGPPEAPEVPPEERPLDPRSIARASLAAGRNRSLWWTLSGIAVAVVVTFLTDAVVGTRVLAVLLLGYAVVRGAGKDAPVAVTVRSQPVDVAVLVSGALALLVLAQIVPVR
ncbi:DUF3017 domain-containing protein [Cellulomonas sp. zg-ZUI222]|uniref:DUF3017 domain-containing protein n=1 Tax=Cellulomonas wangleii TaxID=2816956 RepID=A0ABX8DDE4_9CELL|nr:DUF3017 domain-containing protein [Cellulomonas sp. zg-ZUI22]MBO0920632.1 DUF3017 domain-containing protein [Cellulomonas wangleii]MBO0922950.1 DUF3017 domain-containing protein [Cellulomonas wangleii]QVI64287.1 DUF3017 domain-containing protein [Cellulomonas wangleii]